jgi:hypothetical protein
MPGADDTAAAADERDGMTSQAASERPSHRYGVVAAVVAAVILLGSAALLLWAFSPPSLGAGPPMRQDSSWVWSGRPG